MRQGIQTAPALLSAATLPAAIADMQADYVTEYGVENGREGAYKRSNLSTFVEGSGSEGVILEVVTTANKAFEFAPFLMRIQQ